MELPDDGTDAAKSFSAEHPCAVCGEEAPWEIWDQRVCPPCASSYPEEEIHEGVQECSPLDHIAMGASWKDCPTCKAYCSELTQRTKAWAERAQAQRKTKPQRSTGETHAQET